MQLCLPYMEESASVSMRKQRPGFLSCWDFETENHQLIHYVQILFFLYFGKVDGCIF